MTISWTATGTENYVLESTASLSAPSWQPVATQPAVNAGERSVTEAIAATGARFYRLREP